MVSISGDTIKVSRGDDIIIHLSVYTPSGVLYEFREEDRATFFLLKEPNKRANNKVLLKKEFDENNVMEIKSQDTIFLDGDSYYYAIVLTGKDGFEDTVNYGRFYIEL